MSDARSIIVVTGGGSVATPFGRGTDGPVIAVVIAADGGVDGALAAGLEPDLVVGDFDSISDAGRAWIEANGTRIDRHPPDKDDTDTALALQHAAVIAAERGIDQLLVLSPHGTDRFDHLLGTLIALGDPSLGEFHAIELRLGSSGITRVHVVHPGHRIAIDAANGSVFSLLAMHGPCHGIDVTRARWPLHDASLLPGSTLGISNEASEVPVTIAVRDGVLSVVVPPPIPADHPEVTS